MTSSNTETPIKTLPELITRLESIRTDLDARHLTLRQYEHVGWAARPIESLLDRCREEAASSSRVGLCADLFRSLWPHLPSTRALPVSAAAAAAANANNSPMNGATP